MAHNGTLPEKNPDFKAELVRERFILHPHRQQKPAGKNAQIAVGNRLNIQCFDHNGENKTDFIIRAQNIHTCLKIGAHVAEHWYNFAHLKTTGKDRFNWDQVYLSSVKDYEQRWNPDCWACLYSKGRVLHETAPNPKSQVLDIIEQVFAFEKCSYHHIVLTAQRLFDQAGRQVDIEYDSNTAMELFGNAGSVRSNITYRDVEGRSTLKLEMTQKKSKYVKGAVGAKIKLHECLDVTALIFEGLQLGFIVGRSNYEINKGMISIGHRDSVQADFALRRITMLEKSLEALKQKHHLGFRPKPDFHRNIRNIEHSFHEL